MTPVKTENIQPSVRKEKKGGDRQEVREKQRCGERGGEGGVRVILMISIHI